MPEYRMKVAPDTVANAGQKAESDFDFVLLSPSV
jgi:hypothetical protein